MLDPFQPKAKKPDNFVGTWTGAGSLPQLKTTSQPSVVTSDSARTIVNNDINQLGAAQQQIANRPQFTEPISPADTTPAPEPSLTDQLGLPSAQVDSSFVSAIESGISATSKKLDALQTKIDASSQATIDSIKREYDALIEDQRDFNKSFEGGVTTAGLRSGRNRYAHEIQLGIFKGAVDDGIDKIERIVAKKDAAVREAQLELDSASYKKLSDIMDGYRETLKEERKAVQTTFDNTLKLSQELRSRTKAARDKINDENAQKNIIRDDARASIKTIVSNFGGIDVNDLTQQSLIELINIADTAGIPFETLMGETVQEARLKVSKETLAATERQRAISNSIARTNIAIKRENQAIARTKAESGVTVDTSDIQKLGLPRVLLGYSESELERDFKSKDVPWWFRDSKYEDIPKLEDESIDEYEKRIQPQWEKVRQSTIESTSPIFSGGYGYGAPQQTTEEIDLTD